MTRFSKIFSHKSGHSLRSGGATALAVAGFSFDFIVEAGRWKSEAFRGYIRGHPILRMPQSVLNPHNHPLGASLDVRFDFQGGVPPCPPDFFNSSDSQSFSSPALTVLPPTPAMSSSFQLAPLPIFPPLSSVCVPSEPQSRVGAALFRLPTPPMLGPLCVHCPVPSGYFL